MIFGRYTGRTASGLNYNLPFPIGSVEKLQVTNRIATNIGFMIRPDLRNPARETQIDLPEESLMLTGDENIADVKFVVIWQIDPAHPEILCFQSRRSARDGKGGGRNRRCAKSSAAARSRTS